MAKEAKKDPNELSVEEKPESTLPVANHVVGD